MYSFRQRGDTTVIDEPLYAHYLVTTGIWHPGRDDVLASQDGDGVAVIREVILGPSPTPIVFFKQMAHHLIGLDWSFLDSMTNVILTRDPRAVLASFTKQVDDVNEDTTGLPTCVRLLDRMLAAGETPIVVDAADLLAEPGEILHSLCLAIGIPWDASMLAWELGPVPEDGVWGVHWYAKTHASTGFEPGVPKSLVLSDDVEEIASRCRPMYERLREYAITGTP